MVETLWAQGLDAVLAAPGNLVPGLPRACGVWLVIYYGLVLDVDDPVVAQLRYLDSRDVELTVSI